MLSRARLVLAIAAGALLLLSQPAFADDPPPPPDGVGVGCARISRGVNAYDEGTAETGAPQQGSSQQGVSAPSGSSSSSSGTDAGISAPADPNACGWKPLPVNPIAGSVLWHGGDAASGSVEYSTCAADPAAGAAGNFRFVPNAAPGVAPAAPPPPTPEELAQQAYQQLPIPVPSMNFGPDDTRIAVRYWLHLWLDDPGAVTATATAGAVSVTAVARLSSVTWTMGEPVSAENLYTPAAPITCQGPGVNPGPAVDTTADPGSGECAYMYPGAVDARADRQCRYMAGDGHGDLDDHLGGEHRPVGDVASPAKSSHDAGACWCLEHGHGRERGSAADSMRPVDSGCCRGPWVRRGSACRLGFAGPVPVDCREWLPRWWPYNSKHDEGRGSHPRPSSTLRGLLLS
jgi:hypothetical protein